MDTPELGDKKEMLNNNPPLMDLVGVSKFLSSRALYEERTELMKMKEQGGKGRITRFVSQGHECELRIYALSM